MRLVAIKNNQHWIKKQIAIKVDAKIEISSPENSLQKPTGKAGQYEHDKKMWENYRRNNRNSRITKLKSKLLFVIR